MMIIIVFLKHQKFHKYKRVSLYDKDHFENVEIRLQRVVLLLIQLRTALVILIFITDQRNSRRKFVQVQKMTDPFLTPFFFVIGQFRH